MDRPANWPWHDGRAREFLDYAESQSGARTLGVSLPNGTFDATQLPAYQALTGHRPATLMSFVSWADPNVDGSNKFPRYMLDNVTPPGVTPVITWTPLDFTNPSASQTAFKLDAITAGNHNAYIDAWAADCKAWGRPVVLRPMHEMNTDFYPWCINAPGQTNSAAKYIAAWRYIWGRFAAAGVTNVKWAWCPNRVYGGTVPDFTPCYPGDDYVDQLGLDAYNYGTDPTHGLGTWDTPATVFSADLDRLKAINSSKPVYIFETASVEVGGDKAAWIADAFGTYFKTRPQVKGVFWFQEDKSGSGEVDYRVNTTPAALAAWVKYAVKDPYWGGTYPTDADAAALSSAAVDAEVKDRAVHVKARRPLSGDETLNRLDATQEMTGITKSEVHFVWFTAKKTETKRNIRIPTNVTASGLTAAYVGLYSFDGTTLTRVGTSANVQASVNGANSPTLPISDTPLVAGTDYVAAFVFVGTTAPTLWGCFPTFNQVLWAPEICGKVAGVTLPATVLKSALSFDGAYLMHITT